jgi:hypothetical protein
MAHADSFKGSANPPCPVTTRGERASGDDKGSSAQRQKGQRRKIMKRISTSQPKEIKGLDSTQSM